MNATTLQAVSPSVAPWPLQLRCTGCARPLPVANAFGDIDAQCVCGFLLRSRDGILRALAPERAAYFARFAAEYGEVRAREGRSGSDDYYLGLPFEDRSGRNAWQWSIRAKTFRDFQSHVLAHIENRAARPLDILDIGAGNGWLSYRLALRHHRCAAVDLLENAWDGLGAAHHYLAHLDRPFATVQAEMDRLPFGDSQFDLAIFNASFHYSVCYIRTLRETIRCLRAGGSVVILDTPCYQRESSGAAMVEEREAWFERTYGFRSNSIRVSEFVTPDLVRTLGRECGVRWKVLKPWYGWQWWLRPWKARLLRRREPSKFYVLVGSLQR